MTSCSPPSRRQARPGSRVAVRVAALVVALGALAVAGCATTPLLTPSTHVRTEAAPGVSVASRATFAWEESGVSWQADDPPGVAAELRSLVRTTVVDELANRGYAEAQQAPDFLVGFHATVNDLGEPRLCDFRNRVFYRDPVTEVEVCRPARGATRIPSTYRKGTLVVFVVDSATGVLLWQGLAEGTAESAAATRHSVRDALATMFREFPARSGA